MNFNLTPSGPGSVVCIRLQIKCLTSPSGEVQHCCRGKQTQSSYHSRIISQPMLGACKPAYFRIISGVWKPDLPLPKGTGVLVTFSAGPSPGQVLSGVLCAATLLGALSGCWVTAPRPNLQVTMTCHCGHTSVCQPTKHRCQRRP